MWYTKAAEQGHADAQLALGLMYALGDGVPKNSAESFKWCLISHANGKETAMKLGDYVKKELTPSQIEKAKKEAKKFRDNIKHSESINPPVEDNGLTLPLPNNGSVNRYHTSEAIAPLEIKTRGNSGFYYVKLVDFDTKKPVLTVFIYGGRIVNIDVPLGSFELKYATGDTWYGTKQLFGPNTACSKADKRFDFKQIGNQVSGYAVELYLQVDGNLATAPIPLSEF